MATTIQLDDGTKRKLDALKMHHRESYNDLLIRLIENASSDELDNESLLATIEVLSDPIVMRNIKDALQRIETGDFGTPLNKVKKELGIK
ncbi:hypothetical protein J4456_03025 [Candidatus Pacearchaeota archaeon]|nr:hypothetical protein [Candidatus Pacearchaeota archaeon]